MISKNQILASVGSGLALGFFSAILPSGISVYGRYNNISVSVLQVLGSGANPERSQGLSINTTSHNLGSTRVMLSAYDIVEMGVNVIEDGRAVPVMVFPFSGPRIGIVSFKVRVERLG
uniref:Fungal lipase-type domain-containing protein n=1 Tax=Nelumbo nucifera TaxID=4432 RepID=A0A822Z0A3_NELNU|nr:TPA_asm: hypothetical protein HUJ06_008831 [Nelumbo nucifera]